MRLIRLPHSSRSRFGSNESPSTFARRPVKAVQLTELRPNATDSRGYIYIWIHHHCLNSVSYAGRQQATRTALQAGILCPYPRGRIAWPIGGLVTLQEDGGQRPDGRQRDSTAHGPWRAGLGTDAASPRTGCSDHA
ncbi:hypothetical protein CPLU01_01601 [Colletotrichum plurivorum]|uniref:Uncharacterized protein n=1 Tax=Colletotrichum plurivorum TaxID=2175906 RepID=A0A8H6KY00_9PEZI|nr:hypothetical protein CPLU01_01601 [Colletotrichum plurivorum]